MAIRVVLIEDQLLVLEGMKAALGNHPAIEVVATITGQDDALRLIRETRPDVVVLDLDVKGADLVSATEIATLECICPKVRVLVLVGRDDAFLVRELIDAGVRGCLFGSDEETLSLGTVVCQIFEGEPVYSRKVMAKYIELSKFALAPRELDVLRLADEGLLNERIAEHLAISSSTVRNYLSAAYTKLGISQKAGMNSRVCALNRARRLGFL